MIQKKKMLTSKGKTILIMNSDRNYKARLIEIKLTEALGLHLLAFTKWAVKSVQGHLGF